jgi:hypothetical protein
MASDTFKEIVFMKIIPLFSSIDSILRPRLRPNNDLAESREGVKPFLTSARLYGIINQPLYWG